MVVLRKILIISFTLFLMIGCSAINNKGVEKNINNFLVDKNATEETANLFSNLMMISESNVIFGHHDDTNYGVGWQGDSLRSDVKDVTNSYPGLYGWDFGFLTGEGNKDTVKARMSRLVKEAFERGGVNTFSWHYNNPVTDKSFYDVNRVVEKILPGGGYYLKYLRDLDKIADFANSLKDSQGVSVPIIFRPYHEFDGGWFWWGAPFCTKEEFKKLWITTVEYLRDKKGVRNFLYAFSPDRNFNNEEEFLERYPGDEYVDIIGMDNYWDFGPEGAGLKGVTKKLEILTRIGKEKNKVAAMTETGLEGVVNPKWFTERLFRTFDVDTVKIAYVMVWRNDNPKHHYAPYKGHPAADDFIQFRLNPKILFEDDLPNLYSKKLDRADLELLEMNKKIKFIKAIGIKPLIP